MSLSGTLRAVRRGLGAGRGEMLCSLYRRPVELEHPGPLVSFTFDDFPRSAYTEGGAILKSMGFRGTYYVAMSLMGVSNHQGEHFRIDDLHAADGDGHEVASHTFSHCSGKKVRLDAFRKDVQRGRDALREISGLASSGNFAYPYGDATLAAKRSVGSDMTSCRGIISGVNGRISDLNLLRANRLYGNEDRLAAAQQLVLENERRQGWLIFYTHDVRRNPSDFGCTPGLLEGVVGFVERRKATVLTVAEVLKGIGTHAPRMNSEAAPAQSQAQGTFRI
jgi:peptidoglycan/xylan/chitin deacetylase (PgdA/CDA1 family)